MTLPRMVTGRQMRDLDKVDNASFDHLVLYPVSWSIAAKNLGSWDRDCRDNRHWYAPYCSPALWLLCPWWQHIQPSPCPGGTSAFPGRLRPPAWSPPRPSPPWRQRSVRTAALSSGQRGTGRRDPPQPTWVLDASPTGKIIEESSATCTIRESMLIWSSNMAVTTEMRKSARNLAILFIFDKDLNYTFLDEALQSGQRSKDLDLPTSSSCSPSAMKRQRVLPYPIFHACMYLYFIFSEGIAMGSHELHDSFKIALPRTDGVTKNPCISLGNHFM